MKRSWKPIVATLSTCAALFACSASGDAGLEGDDGDDYASDDELAADDGSLMLGTAQQHMSYPYCVSAASDPDKDGWGWENNMSCIVQISSTSYPTCASAASDPDGDGWGWENNRSCIVQTASSGYPYCASAASDPDGDGWGWESNRSCIVRKSTSTGTVGSCANLEGTASTMAALVVSAAMELKRWQPTQDFAIVKINNTETLQLTSTGKARCADGKCFNTQALLDFQKDEANGKIRFPNNVTLNAPALRSRLVAKFRDQQACEMQPSNGGTTNCPVEEHALTFQKAEKGGCDTNYFFVAKSTSGQALKYPAQLKNKLQWADRDNPYVAFANAGDVVSVDPTLGLNDRGSTSTGACTAACARISATDVTGACCSCSGTTKKYVKSAWSATTFICQ
ncbi:MAG TPA: carbohydrate-binding domain-containing protein [Polyangiaceae bacterium]|jgi:hypothetical protein|nr:carbohydrate-binding domain-containing protein [Polyangiaceae bacterium]